MRLTDGGVFVEVDVVELLGDVEIREHLGMLQTRACVTQDHTLRLSYSRAQVGGQLSKQNTQQIMRKD